jgi:PiT family inorganic phosphate transporter
MTLGTSIGGYKIIKTVGLKMVKLEPYQGTAADLAGSFCLLFRHYQVYQLALRKQKQLQ